MTHVAVHDGCMCSLRACIYSIQGRSVVVAAPRCSHAKALAVCRCMDLAIWCCIVLAISGITWTQRGMTSAAGAARAVYIYKCGLNYRGYFYVARHCSSFRVNHVVVRRRTAGERGVITMRCASTARPRRELPVRQAYMNHICCTNQNQHIYIYRPDSSQSTTQSPQLPSHRSHDWSHPRILSGRM